MNAVHSLRFQHKIKTLCRVLKVNRSTYYKRFSKEEAPRTLENRQIRDTILTIYANAKYRFGAHKVRQRLLTEYGIKISVGRVYRLMKTMTLPKMSTIKPKNAPKSKSVDSDCPNFLSKRFNVTAPNQIWVGDITYVRVNGKFCYVCAVIDLFARRLVACIPGQKIDTNLVIKAFEAAYSNRGKPQGLMFHSDRGVQYTCAQFRGLLDNLLVVQSFSAKGHPYDNAVAESFFKFLKLEELNRRNFAAFAELELALASYAHFYNSQRPHSHNDGLTPIQKEDEFFNHS